MENGRRDLVQIADYDAAAGDVIHLGGLALDAVRETRAAVFLTVGADGDHVIVRGVSTLDQIVFADAF